MTPKLLKKTHLVAGALAMSAIALCGCSKQEEPLPPLTDANCAVDVLKAMPDADLRRRMADACATRNTFVPSPKKTY